MGVFDGGVDGVADDGEGGEDEQDWRPGIPGHAIGNGFARIGAADGEDAGGAESIENPSDEDGATGQLREACG